MEGGGVKYEVLAKQPLTLELGAQQRRNLVHVQRRPYERHFVLVVIPCRLVNPDAVTAGSLPLASRSRSGCTTGSNLGGGPESVHCHGDLAGRCVKRRGAG